MKNLIWLSQTADDRTILTLGGKYIFGRGYIHQYLKLTNRSNLSTRREILSIDYRKMMSK